MIRYDPVSFSVEDLSSFDRVSVYLLSDKLSSFIRLKDSSGIHCGKLDELMKYNMAVVAYKNEGTYFYSMRNVASKSYTGIKLAPAGEKELTRKLNGISSKSQLKGLKRENEFLRFELKDLQRQKNNDQLIRLRERLYHIIFPCAPGKITIAEVSM